MYILAQRGIRTGNPNEEVIMQKLHPNALWLFWIRSLAGIFPDSRKAWKIIQPLLVIGLYAIILSYALSALAGMTKGLTGMQGDEQSMLSSWWQAMTTALPIPAAKAAVAAIVMIFLTLTFWGAYLYYNSYRYEIKNNSIMVRKGILSITESEVPFDKIQNVDIFRDILHRILGLSSIHIQTAGYSESTEAVREKHPGMVSEASIDGIGKDEAERIKQLLIKK